MNVYNSPESHNMESAGLIRNMLIGSNGSILPGQWYGVHWPVKHQYHIQPRHPGPDTFVLRDYPP